MNFKHFFIIFLACSTVFFPYFLRENFVDYDSYYFLSKICKPDFELFEVGLVPPLALLTINALPCDFFLIKALLFLLFLSSTLIISFMGELFDKKNGWMAGLFAFFSPFIFRLHLKIENDSFAFPLIFLAIYFFLKHLESQKPLDFFLSVFFIFFATGFWGAALYLPFGFMFSTFHFLALSLVFSVFFGPQLLSNALPNALVAENNPIGSLFSIIFYLPALFLIQKDKKMGAILFLTGFGLVNPKFLVLSLPLLCVVMIQFVQKKPSLLFPAKIVIGILILGFSVSWFFGGYEPTPVEWNTVQFAVDLAKDSNQTLYNDWSLGWIVEWMGITPKQFAGPQKLEWKKGIVLTGNNLDQNCTKIREVNYKFSPDALLRVYEC